MKRYEKTIATILIAVTLVVGSISILPEKWNVTENKSVTHMSTEYAGCTYKYGANNNKIEQEMIDENDYSKKNNYTITMREKGKKKVLIEGVERGVITNGKYLYYTKYENRKFYMYCMKLSTQKKKYSVPRNNMNHMINMDIIYIIHCLYGRQKIGDLLYMYTI